MVMEEKERYARDTLFKVQQLLGYIDGKYEIKCPRCGTTNAEKESVNETIRNY